MKVRPTQKLILWFGILFAIGLAGFLASNGNRLVEKFSGGADSPQSLLRQKQVDRLHFSRNQRKSSGRDLDERKEVLAMKERMVAEFPALQVDVKPVPDDQNAFLMLFELDAFIKDLDPPLSEEFRKLLKGDAPWDADEARRFLAEHADLVGRIEKIAALETRSSENMPANYKGFIGGRSGIIASDILLLKARLAAETGDEEETFRLFSAASNLGSHFQKIESPTLLCATVYQLIDRNVKKAAVNILLPALGQKADLSRWKSTFSATSYSTSNLAHVIRGEWNASSEHMLFPGLIVDETNGNLPDAEAVAHALSSSFNDWVTTLPTLSLAQVESFSPQVETLHLSEPGRKWVEAMALTGFKQWANGYLRGAVVSSQMQAALDLLILEQAGATLSAEDAARLTQDPMSGMPFVFDPAKRELFAPEVSSRLKVDPLAVP